MNKLSFALTIMIILASCGENARDNAQIFSVTNESNLSREEVVEIAIDTKESDVVFAQDNIELPTELIDSDGDGIAEKALVLVKLEVGETKKLALRKSKSLQQTPKMTQAELSIKEGGEWTDKEYEGGTFVNLDFLRVPDRHTDHTYFIRYEGPGWESDKMAYRFYLDWRNGVDVFGKLTPEMVLQDVGQDGFDSYHELSEWGMDLLKVGSTLGGGSIGRFSDDMLYRFKEVDSVTCQITKNGLLSSEIVTKYYGWKDGGEATNLVSTIGINAASGLTSHQLDFSAPIAAFCTGLVKNDGEEYIDEVNGNYRILATYGKYSLNNDQMGLAVVLENSSIEDVVEGAGSHVVLFKPVTKIKYYFVAVWEKGVNPIQSMEEFAGLLNKEVTRLNVPLKVSSVQ